MLAIVGIVIIYILDFLSKKLKLSFMQFQKSLFNVQCTGRLHRDVFHGPWGKEDILINLRQNRSSVQCSATQFTLNIMIFWCVCSSCVNVKTTSNYSFSSVTFSLIYTVSIFLFIKMTERMSNCVNNEDTPSFLAETVPKIARSEQLSES